MTILSIETSCDETAISIVSVGGAFPNARFEVIADSVLSQAEIHREYGGVFPNVAKREHALALVPLLEKTITDASIDTLPHTELFPEVKEELQELLAREEGLADALISFFEKYHTPNIDLIAVTNGPGLEPALWVGVNFAKALSRIWNVPVIGINHMEGHVFASIFDGTKIAPLEFPAIALLISGGHTELVLMKQWGQYEKIGETRDDAVGEAFDKVARMLGLPYPGGPEISKLAEEACEKNLPETIELPRPMLQSGDLDFSFSGLKTAVLYTVKDREIPHEEKMAIAREFENAVTEVLLKKTLAACELHGAKSLILGGGVSANTHIRQRFESAVTDVSDVSLYLPQKSLTTDNAVMIALAASIQYQKRGALKDGQLNTLKASGNLSITSQI